VLSDQTDWRAVRRYLNHHRSALAGMAAGLYPISQRIRRTTLIAPPSWLPPEPVDLADITMTWVPDTPAASEPTGHEMADLRSRKDTQITTRALPFRSLIDDPFDCYRRAMLPAIT